MTARLHVLVYGSVADGVCDFYRFGMHRSALADLGVDLREWSDRRVAVPAGFEDRPQQALAQGLAAIDRDEIDWADVIVFRRWYQTVWACAECDTIGPAELAIRGHAARTGHRPAEPDVLLRPLLNVIEQSDELLRGRAVLYDTDDDLLAPAPGNGLQRRLGVERDVVAQMARLADLVTVSTPVLGRALSPLNPAIRVIRNAVDPAWYADRGASARLMPGPRVAFYGSAGRLVDYEVCRPAVDELRARVPGVERVWLGAGDEPSIRRLVDRVLPYVEGVPAFARELTRLAPDIGVAPLSGSSYSRARSELHFLEYTMAGAATVASGYRPGPYDVIRDGVDGLLASSKSEWRRALLRLATSPDLRDELAGRARERVVAEYDPRRRAGEWAEAYRWAAEHAGHRRGGGRGIAPPAREAEGRSALLYRQRSRQEAETIPGALAEWRSRQAGPDGSGVEAEPLVSVLLAHVGEPLDVLLQSVRSVLLQTYRRIEIVVAGAEPPGRESLPADDRVRLVRAPACAVRPDDPEAAWDVAYAEALNTAAGAASGSFLAPLPVGAEFLPDHVGALLSAALENRLEFVYGAGLHSRPGGGLEIVNAWPPRPYCVADGSELYAAGLAALLPYDGEAWRAGETVGWNHWRRVFEAGARAGNLEQLVLVEERRASRTEPGRFEPADPETVFGGYLGVLAAVHRYLRPATYLEVGVETGKSLGLALRDTLKVAVDPEPQLQAAVDRRTTSVLALSSDEYFRDPDARGPLEGHPVDLVFLDGMHRFENVLRDFVNAERLAASNGVVLVHDCLPSSPAVATRERATNEWTGDVWKLVPCLRAYRPDLRIVVVDVAPSGLAVITGLDPSSTVLSETLEALYREFVPLELPAAPKARRNLLRPVAPTWAAVRAALDGADPGARG